MISMVIDSYQWLWIVIDGYQLLLNINGYGWLLNIDGY